MKSGKRTITLTTDVWLEAIFCVRILCKANRTINQIRTPKSNNQKCFFFFSFSTIAETNNPRQMREFGKLININFSFVNCRCVRILFVFVFLSLPHLISYVLCQLLYVYLLLIRFFCFSIAAFFFFLWFQWTIIQWVLYSKFQYICRISTHTPPNFNW